MWSVDVIGDIKLCSSPPKEPQKAHTLEFKKNKIKIKSSKLEVE